MIKYFCDGCGKEVEKMEYFENDITIEDKDSSETYHFCGECMRKIKEKFRVWIWEEI